MSNLTNIQDDIDILSTHLHRLDIDTPSSITAALADAASIEAAAQLTAPDVADVAAAVLDSKGSALDDPKAVKLLTAYVLSTSPALTGALYAAGEVRRTIMLTAALRDSLDDVFRSLASKTAAAVQALTAYRDAFGEARPTAEDVSVLGAGGTTARIYADAVAALADLAAVHEIVTFLSGSGHLTPSIPYAGALFTVDPATAADLPISADAWTAFSAGPIDLPNSVEGLTERLAATAQIHRDRTQVAAANREELEATGAIRDADGAPVFVISPTG